MAMRHGKASLVKRKLPPGQSLHRELCNCTQNCGEYIPFTDDKYSVCGTNTDDLWHLGMGYPLFFVFQKRMAMMLAFVCLLYCLPLIIDSYNVFYDTVSITGSERKNTSLLIFGSYFAFIQLRLTYAFDFGVWNNNVFWYI